MMEQFKEFTGWKCVACGAVLKTCGAKRHMEHCKYIAPALDGQLGFFDNTKQDQNESRRD